jgi:hypothetical protein
VRKELSPGDSLIRVFACFGGALTQVPGSTVLMAARDYDCCWKIKNTEFCWANGMPPAKASPLLPALTLFLACARPSPAPLAAASLRQFHGCSLPNAVPWLLRALALRRGRC